MAASKSLASNSNISVFPVSVSVDFFIEVLIFLVLGMTSHFLLYLRHLRYYKTVSYLHLAGTNPIQIKHADPELIFVGYTMLVTVKYPEPMQCQSGLHLCYLEVTLNIQVAFHTVVYFFKLSGTLILVRFMYVLVRILLKISYMNPFLQLSLLQDPPHYLVERVRGVTYHC